jgi:transcriptional regulator with XRE-family HTH domain
MDNISKNVAFSNDMANKRRTALQRHTRDQQVTPTELARRIGAPTPNAIYNFLHGWSKSLSQATLERIAGALGVSLDELSARPPLGGTKQPADVVPPPADFRPMSESDRPGEHMVGAAGSTGKPSHCLRVCGDPGVFEPLITSPHHQVTRAPLDAPGLLRKIDEFDARLERLEMPRDVCRVGAG